jgi:hypothetical protein
MFPNQKPNNPPMTRGQRRVWLALEEQKRRRARAAKGISGARAIVLTSDGHGRLTWTVNFEVNTSFAVYQSTDGLTWGHAVDGADPSARAANESGVAGYFRICVTDAGGNDVLPYSNVVYSDGL